MEDRGTLGALIQRGTTSPDTPQDPTARVPEPCDLRLDDRRDAAGVMFARLSVLPALLATPWLIAGFGLLAFGWFRPIPVTCLAAALAVPVLYYGWRSVPSLPAPGEYALPLPPGRPRLARTPWWTIAAVGAIALAFFADQAVYHSQFVFFILDPGAYYQFAAWIAGHGSSFVPQQAALFGGSHGGALQFARQLPYQTGNSFEMPFMAGLPMVLAGVMWAAGHHTALLLPALLGGLAVLVFAGLAARLIGARWAPLAALVVAVSLPMQFTSRSAYSEPLAEIMLLGGLSLVIDSLRDYTADAAPGGTAFSRRPRRVAAGLGGLLLGLTVLVRIDGASDVLPLIPFCGALFVRRRPQAVPLAIGLAAGLAVGLTDGLVFAWPYLMYTNGSSVLPLAAISALVLAATAAGTLYYRHRPLPRWWNWLDSAALPAPFLILAAFALRPYLQHVRGLNYLGQVIRTYDEIALHWVGWYLGIPVILLAALGAATLTRKVLRGQARSWALPLMLLAWTTVTFLYRPGITPTQPWASRRLVPAVMPAFILLAVWALAGVSAWMRDRWPTDPRRNLVTALCGVLVVAPAAVTNWGPGLSTAHGIGLHADGLADQRTYLGELYWTERLCAKLPARAVVVYLSGWDFKWEGGEVRSICNVPVAGYLHNDGYGSATPSDAPGVLSVVRDIQRAGRVPVLLSRTADQLKPYQASGTAMHIPLLRTTTDPRTVHKPPTAPRPLTIDVWMWTPSS